MRREELRSLILAARELGQAWMETETLMRNTTITVRRFKGLWRRGRARSPLITLGVALIAFPDPTISDIVGCALILLGLVESRIRPPPIYIEDVFETTYKAFSELEGSLSTCSVDWRVYSRD